MAKHIQETNIKTIGGESIIGTGDISIPNTSKLEVIREESRGSATYDVDLTELTSEETSSTLRLGFYNRDTDVYMENSPLIELIKKTDGSDTSISLYTSLSNGGESNRLEINPYETLLLKKARYLNPSGLIFEDDEIPSYKAVKDYVAENSGTLQSITDGEGNNVTNNLLIVTGTGNAPDIVPDGLLLIPSGFQVVLNEQNKSSFGYNESIDSTVINHGMGNDIKLEGRSQTAGIAGFGFSTRVSGQPAINNNEFVTKSQLDAKPTGATSLQLLTTGTGSNVTDNLLFVTGNNNIPSPIPDGTLLASTGLFSYKNQGTTLELRYSESNESVFLNGLDTPQLRLRGGANKLSMFNSRVSGLQAENSGEFVTKDQLDSVKNQSVTLDTPQTIIRKKTFKTSNATTGNAESPIEIVGGNGANGTATTGFNQGGNAGDIKITSGNGGAALTSSDTNIGGKGGEIYILAGDGGFGLGGTTAFGGAGGNALLQAGNSLGNGLGGNAELKAGNSQSGNGGNVHLVAGWGHNDFSSTEFSGHIYLGVSNAGVSRGNIIVGGTNTGGGSGVVGSINLF